MPTSGQTCESDLRTPAWLTFCDTLNKLPYLDAVVRESLRIDPSVTHSVREAKKDIVVPLGTPVRGRDGVTMHEIVVKKGQMITMGQ